MERDKTIMLNINSTIDKCSEKLKKIASEKDLTKKNRMLKDVQGTMRDIDDIENSLNSLKFHTRYFRIDKVYMEWKKLKNNENKNMTAKERADKISDLRAQYLSAKNIQQIENALSNKISKFKSDIEQMKYEIDKTKNKNEEINKNAIDTTNGAAGKTQKNSVDIGVKKQKSQSQTTNINKTNKINKISTTSIQQKQSKSNTKISNMNDSKKISKQIKELKNKPSNKVTRQAISAVKKIQLLEQDMNKIKLLTGLTQNAADIMKNFNEQSQKHNIQHQQVNR